MLLSFYFVLFRVNEVRVFRCAIAIDFTGTPTAIDGSLLTRFVVVFCVLQVTSGKKKGKITKCFLWKCHLCKSNPIMKVFGGSTGVLFKHLDRYHPNEYALARKTSKHSKCRLDENGAVIELYSFKESLPQHVKYAHTSLPLTFVSTDRCAIFLYV